MDISLYKGEDQLDEIERKRKGEERKVEKKATAKKEVKQRVEKEVKDEIDFKPEAKKRGRPKADGAEEKVKQAEPRKGRRAASNISYDQDSFDFLEEDDDEVMPAPKKRKSQDSINPAKEGNKDKGDKGSKVEAEKEAEPAPVQTEKKKEEEEELSTSEKAALAEKAKMEEKEKEEDSANATSEAAQHAKKRGRKPKP